MAGVSLFWSLCEDLRMPGYRLELSSIHHYRDPRPVLSALPCHCGDALSLTLARVRDIEGLRSMLTIRCRSEVICGLFIEIISL